MGVTRSPSPRSDYTECLKTLREKQCIPSNIECLTLYHTILTFNDPKEVAF